jgi:hypothetical protein
MTRNVVLEVLTVDIRRCTAPNVRRLPAHGRRVEVPIANKPKNTWPATREYPFNDVVLRSIHVDYVWTTASGIAAAVRPGGTVEAGKTGDIEANGRQPPGSRRGAAWQSRRPHGQPPVLDSRMTLQASRIP